MCWLVMRRRVRGLRRLVGAVERIVSLFPFVLQSMLEDGDQS